MTELPDAANPKVPDTTPTTATTPRKSFVRLFIRWLSVGVVGLWSVAALMIVGARWIDPPTTAVHMQRRMQAWIHHTAYHERYRFVPLSQISSDLQHAVIAAEDARFYQHHGFDWQEIEIAAEDNLEGERTRGASTITQQLVKNLFFGTGRSILRKGAEATLVPVAEFALGKRHSGDIPQRGRMGPGDLRRGIGVPLLWRNRRSEYRPGTRCTACGNSAGSAEAATGADESL